jgi:hypothetical protein
VEVKILLSIILQLNLIYQKKEMSLGCLSVYLFKREEMMIKIWDWRLIKALLILLLSVLLIQAKCYMGMILSDKITEQYLFYTSICFFEIWVWIENR